MVAIIFSETQVWTKIVEGSLCDGPQWFLPPGVQCPGVIPPPWVLSGFTDLLLMAREWQMWREVTRSFPLHKDCGFSLACTPSLSLGLLPHRGSEASTAPWVNLEANPSLTSPGGDCSHGHHLTAALRKTLKGKHLAKPPLDSWPTETVKGEMLVVYCH